MEIAICKVKPKTWNEYQKRQQHIQSRSGRELKMVPMPLYYGGTRYVFDPTCELPRHIAEGLARRQNGEIIEILEVKSVHEKERSVIMNDEKDEHDFRYGEVHLCKYCGWPFATPGGRGAHEKRFCKRKGE